MRKIKYICFFIGIHILLSTTLLGQNEINLSGSVQWGSLLKSVDPSSGKVLQLLYFEKAVYNDFHTLLPCYEGMVKLSSSDRGIIEVKLTQCYFEELPPNELANAAFLADISDSIKVSYSLIREKKIPYLRYSFIPLRRNTQNGKIERLKFFSIKGTFSDSNLKSGKIHAFSSFTFAKNSVLEQGDWYKFQVSKSGVYKITFSDLKSLGLQNPGQVRIYGNGGSMLSEVYTGKVPDDPEEIPVMVITGTDGIFNEGDYIIFYLEGPVTLSYNSSSKSFSYSRNEFCDNITYFITSAPDGKQVVSYAPPTGEPTMQVGSFDGLNYHEENLTNLIKSGRAWYGEDFKAKSSYDFSFNFPDLVKSDQVNIEAEVLGRSESYNYFRFQQNGNSIGSVAVAPVTGSHLSDHAVSAIFKNSFTPASDNITIRVTHDQNGLTSAEGWLSYLKLQGRQNLAMHNEQLFFRDSRSVGQGRVVSYNISNATSGIQVWDISDLHNVKLISLDNTFTFKADADSLHEYVAFYPANLLSPTFLEDNHGKVTNQNLHGLHGIDFVIISHSKFLKQAQELADLHSEHDGLNVAVVTPEQVYNEFSSGNPDPAAIRNFMKMLYDKAVSSAEMPKYLLLLGDGSFDNRTPISTNSKNTNYIITYESTNSLSPSYSYVSDDYFGLLDNNESISTGLLDIGIGRFPVQTGEQAENIINKIKKYINQKSLGDWRNNICFIGDDEDGNLHMEQADLLATYVSNNYQFFNIEKIYLDAYPQVSTATGQRYPDVTSAILSQINKGSLIINYTGHGGEDGLTAEQVLTSKDIDEWKNDLYPLFVTATCEFGRYDDNQKTSAGEKALLNPDGGGIGLLTTTRVVYSSQNYDLNRAFYTDALVKADDNLSFKLGDIVRKTKNGAGTDMNKLCFTLLGDPALSLAYPTRDRIVTDSINNIVTTQIDTLNAYGTVTVRGHIVDGTGQKLNNFNGVLLSTVFDKSKKVSTLSNDNNPVLIFNLQNNVLFRGKVSVKNGDFKFNFVLPRDMDYNFGFGKISYYATDTISNVSGCFNNFVIGGMTTDVTTDNQGPGIKLYINDTTFKNGGITSEYPTLLARVSDEHGINPGGNSIGHDIVATIDKQNYVLNSYFQTDVDNYKQGSVIYKFPKLAPGSHTVTFKIWDIFNNSSQSEIEFNVINESNISVKGLYNYPNPFNEYTYFFFEHNQSSDNLSVNIEIFNTTGSKVRVLNSVISPAGYTSEPLFWDGNDQNGNKIKRGVYIYRVILRSLKGSAISPSQKLVVIE